jgi:hypothetical protein
MRQDVGISPFLDPPSLQVPTPRWTITPTGDPPMGLLRTSIMVQKRAWFGGREGSTAWQGAHMRTTRQRPLAKQAFSKSTPGHLAVTRRVET